MNIIIVRQEELREDGKVLLSGRRARHIINILGAELGQSLRVGVLNGSTGTGIVENIDDIHVELACTFNGESRPSTGIDLILAMPRPKVMKRLWTTLASLGVNRIFITNANKVEKCYFGTRWIEPEHYEAQLIEGLEQSGDTRLPEVTIVRRLRPFIEKNLDELFPDCTRIIAHPSDEVSNHGPEEYKAPVVVALGPEGGWTDRELEMFKEAGFLDMSLGPRTLKTDTACIALISIVGHIIEGK